VRDVVGGDGLALVTLFAVGVYDLAVETVTIVVAGPASPSAVLAVIDVALLLLVAVGVHRTVVACVERREVLSTVINVAIAAPVRKVIGLRAARFAPHDAAADGVVYRRLPVVLVAAFYAVHRFDPRSASPGSRRRVPAPTSGSR
jgi:uncharacterized membrane protein (DUF373 family)